MKYQFGLEPGNPSKIEFETPNFRWMSPRKKFKTACREAKS